MHPSAPVQERDLAHCTFQPSLGHRRRPRTTQPGGLEGGRPASPCVPAISAARPPDVLAQVQALLDGEQAQPAGSGAERGAQGEQLGAGGGGERAPAGAAGGAGGAAAGSFSAFLGQVTAELRKMQAE